MPAAENGSLNPDKDMDLAPIINGMETLPKTKQVTCSLLLLLISYLALVLVKAWNPKTLLTGYIHTFKIQF